MFIIRLLSNPLFLISWRFLLTQSVISWSLTLFIPSLVFFWRLGYGNIGKCNSEDSSILNRSKFDFDMYPLILGLKPLNRVSTNTLSTGHTYALSMSCIFTLSLSNKSRMYPCFSLSTSSNTFWVRYFHASCKMLFIRSIFSWLNSFVELIFKAAHKRRTILFWLSFTLPFSDRVTVCHLLTFLFP